MRLWPNGRCCFGWRTRSHSEMFAGECCSARPNRQNRKGKRPCRSRNWQGQSRRIEARRAVIFRTVSLRRFQALRFAGFVMQTELARFGGKRLERSGLPRHCSQSGRLKSCREENCPKPCEAGKSDSRKSLKMLCPTPKQIKPKRATA